MKATARVLFPAVLCSLVAGVSAQAKSHDPLASARAKARAENQRVLLLLTGGDAAIGDALSGAMRGDRALSKLLRYEYQLAAQPADSLAGSALRKRLGLAEMSLPTLAVLDKDDKVVATLAADRMAEAGNFAGDRVSELLQQNQCAPADARVVLADGLAEAKKSKRHAFVYLSAPW